MQKILVVEDDLDIQELLENFLQDAGYEVTAARMELKLSHFFRGFHLI